MKTIFKHNLHRVFIVLISTTSMFLSSCSDNPVVEPRSDKNIYEIVNSTQGFDSLRTYLQIFPELITVLESKDQKTFFAPDNQAFIELLSSPGFPPNIRRINPDIIKNMLTYHIIDNVELEKHKLNADIITLSSELIKINSDQTLMTGAINTHIHIKTADIRANNGIIHVVESVLVPPSASATAFSELLGNLAGAALLSDRFSYLARLINAVDIGQLQTDKIATLLKGDGPDIDGDGKADGLTVFFTPNTYFDALAKTQGISVSSLLNNLVADKNALRINLKTHIIPGSLPTSNFAGGTVFSSVGGLNLTFSQAPISQTNPLGILVKAGTNNPVPIVAGNVRVKNGFIHVIAGTLIK